MQKGPLKRTRTITLLNTNISVALQSDVYHDLPRAGFPATPFIPLLVPISNSFMARNYCTTWAGEGGVQGVTGIRSRPSSSVELCTKAGPWRKQRSGTALVPWQFEGVTSWRK